MKITIFEIIKMIKDGKLKDGTKIRCSDFPATYIYKNETLGFYGTEGFIELTLRDILKNINYANYEILEEEKKIPEKFKVHSFGDKDENGNFVSNPFPTDEEFMNKINEIIDYLEYLKSKGDE